ncbi:MAG TPA: phosphate acyltransferase PlsX [Gammaproteobacteria bacterium]|nr:phosphate acyltransferase PlsX [Gammaproteobacteria bacterium]
MTRSGIHSRRVLRLKKITIAIDAMGGDHGPPVIVPACLQVLRQYPCLHLVLVGDEAILQRLLQNQSCDLSRLTIQHASQHVLMDEPPSQALRTKKDSSMRVAINLVKTGEAEACVSAGNTGALMATARFVLKTLPGIDRPAIVSTFPTISGKNVRILDLGANVDSSAEHLFQFAIMGSVLASAVDAIPMPKVCLLNIGHEDIKGNELVKQAAQLLSQTQAIHYAGYVEGDEIYQGNTDVVVCDGFVGNVALKVSEGMAIFIRNLLKEGFSRTWFTRLAALVSMPVLKSLVKRIDPDRYNGACLIGLPRIVIKSHGGAKIQAFAHAIEEAIIQIEKNVPERISVQVEQLLKLSPRSP